MPTLKKPLPFKPLLLSLQAPPVTNLILFNQPTPTKKSSGFSPEALADVDEAFIPLHQRKQVPDFATPLP